MIAVDTNVIVRFLTRDEPLQFSQSFKLIENEAIFIPDTVILETVWVLDFVYKFEPLDISPALRDLFGLPNVHLKDPVMMARTLDWFEQGMDFADACHLASSAECTELKTFDKAFIKQAKGLSGCTVKSP